MNPNTTYESLVALRGSLVDAGAIYQWVLVGAAAAVSAIAVVPAWRTRRGLALAALAVLLGLGEAALVVFHLKLYSLTAIADPVTDSTVARIAVPLWVESEKLFVWALIVAVMGSLMRRQRSELLSGVMLVAAVLTAAAALLGKPFTQPLPSFMAQYEGYLQAMQMGGVQAQGAFQGMVGSARYYYNSWYMWVHPPLLFLSYGCFAVSFVATVLMIARKRASFETTSYRWARMGYLPLTFGMLIGFPWAIAAWAGESWWWSGKVNMSIMMWMLYTAHLHARLYLRRSGMWRTVAALAVLSFVILVLTYVTTYVVPGAHSYAYAETGPAVALARVLRGGGS